MRAHADEGELARIQAELRAFSTTPDGPWVPAWSSYLLDKLVDRAAAAGGATQVIEALWALLGETRAPLDRTMANLVKDVVVRCFLPRRPRREEVDLTWMVAALASPPPPAQAYLAAWTLPAPASEAYAPVMLEALRGTAFFEEARVMLGHEA